MSKLNLQFFAEEKTEKATPKKRRDTRKKGQVAKSSDLVTAVSLLLMFLLFMFAVPWMGSGLIALMRTTYEKGLSRPLTEGSVAELMTSLVMDAAKIVAPVMIAAFIIAIIANVAQIGLLFSTEAIAFKGNRINPISGFKRIYSIRALIEFLKSMLKILVVGLTTFLVIWLNIHDLVSLGQKPVMEALAIVGKIVLEMGIASSVLLLFLGLLDFMYQKFDFEKNIRMSKKEIKDEYKKSEGDPLIKSKIRERQRQMAMRRMMQEIPNADVVITNPTHYAVALVYKDGKMDAPTVVAKGADYIALKIKEIAKQNGVVTVERRDLARALYHQLDIGDQIPEVFFKAVAEILAYVYSLKRG
ncbi:flagellar biosynthesis protein FlhB [Camelliibacillus cellulosilyticus]|uniref:Flagellar biosynthetic protein FlhB n=1 Tax=Camelliibacillus cellulosilyticus TaxID=2174486 RepID=A0ABV9GJM4_9BACL